MRPPAACPVDHTHETGCVGIPTPQPEQRAFWLCPKCLDYHICEQPPRACRCGHQAAWELVPDSIWRNTERLKMWWQGRWREHQQSHGRQRAIPAATTQPWRLPDPTAEACARRLPEQVANLSMVTARKLVMEYGVAAVERAACALQARADVRNPAGFLVSLLRSEHKFLSNGAKKPAGLRRAGHTDWLQQMGQSAYVSFLANAEDFAPLGITI